MGKICSKIKCFKKKSELCDTLIPGDKKRSLSKLIEIARKRYRKKSKNRRYRNKNGQRRT